MNDREQKQNDALVRCIRHDTSGELHRREKLIMDTEREERCLRRAVWLMAVLLAATVLALGYSLLLLYELPVYHARIVNHILLIIGLAAGLSLLVFAALWILCRNRLAERREEVRRLIMKLLADQAGGSGPAKNS